MSESDRRRVEIVHESLLTNWPRLVRWRTQDEEGAQLRDELRLAATVWEQHGRPDDLLWSGTTFREYQLWRERYSGGLTALEEAFASAMSAKALRRKRRRQSTVALAFLVLGSVLAYVTILRQRAVGETRRAEAAAQLAEASKLLALGEVELAKDPGAALAHALASLELQDSEAGRLFALRSLSAGPPSLVTDDWNVSDSAEFSPNGDLLAAGGLWSFAIHPRGGGPAALFEESGDFSPSWGWEVAFLRQRDLLAVRSARDPSRVGIWSTASGQEIQSFRTEGTTKLLSRRDALFLLVAATRGSRDWSEGSLQRWGVGSSEPELVGRWKIPEVGAEDLPAWMIDLDGAAEWLVYGSGRRVYARTLRHPSGSDGVRVLGEHEAEIVSVRADPWRQRVATGDAAGEVRVWSLAPSAREPLRVFQGRGKVGRILFEPNGARLAVDYREQAQPWQIWSLDAPEGAGPLALASRVAPTADWADGAAFSPDGSWFVTQLGGQGKTLHFFPVAHRYSAVLRGSGSGVPALAFTSDGRRLLSAFFRSALEVWDLPGGERRTLWSYPGLIGTLSLAVDPSGTSALTGNAYQPTRLVSIETGSSRLLANGCAASCWTNWPAISGDGRRLAWSVAHGERIEDRGIRVLEIENGQVEVLDESRGEYHASLSYAGGGILHSARVESDGDRPCNAWTVFRWGPSSGERSEVARLPSVIHQPLLFGDGPSAVVIEPVSGACSSDESGTGRGVARILDFAGGASRPLVGHGDRVVAMAIDSVRGLVATGSSDGVVRIGRISDEQPHLLLGHQRGIASLAIDPAGRWLASGEEGESVVRLWPMPDLTKPPLQTLPYDELLAKLRSLTNLRIVADATSPTGYRLDVGPFPGWDTVPEW